MGVGKYNQIHVFAMHLPCNNKKAFVGKEPLDDLGDIIISPTLVSSSSQSMLPRARF